MDVKGILCYSFGRCERRKSRRLGVKRGRVERQKMEEEEEDEGICEVKIKVQSGFKGDQTGDHCRRDPEQ